MPLSAAAVSLRQGRDHPDVYLDTLLCDTIAPKLKVDLGPLLSQTVHVWAFNVDGLDNVHPNCENLSAAERRRAQAFKFEHDRRRFIARREALRQLLGRYLALDPAEIEISEGDGRKPALATAHDKSRAAGVSADIQFNCSHSDGVALFAFTRDVSIGVDLERVRPMQEAEDVARRFFSPHEFRALMKIQRKDRLTAFYECWTRKEAVVKALGYGLATPLDSFTVSFTPGRQAQLLQFDAGEPGNWTVVPLRLSAGYSAALAIGTTRPVNVVRFWS